MSGLCTNWELSSFDGLVLAASAVWNRTINVYSETAKSAAKHDFYTWYSQIRFLSMLAKLINYNTFYYAKLDW